MEAGKREPGMVIDGETDIFIAALLAGTRIGLAPAVTGDAAADSPVQRGDLLAGLLAPQR